jgi:hypothetical protein
MSRTTLCLLTAALLAIGSFLVMGLRTRILGDEVRLPGGPGTWKITMLVQGRTTADARLWTATPLPGGHQQLVREQATSDELVQKPQEQRGDRRELSWSQAPGVSPGPFRVRAPLRRAEGRRAVTGRAGHRRESSRDRGVCAADR